MKMREARIEQNDDGSFQVTICPMRSDEPYAYEKDKRYSAKDLSECMEKIRTAMDEIASVKEEEKRPKKDKSLKTFMNVEKQ